MAKRKPRRRAKPATTKPATRRKSFGPRHVVAAAAVLAVAYGGWSYWQFGQAESRFQALAAAGSTAAERRVPNEGTGHPVAGGFRYTSNPPTSGGHSRRWVDAGFHDRTQTPSMLVHNLEHGNIVIYYDRLDDAVRAQLDAWASMYRGQWSGIVVTPKAGLGQEVVLTAWTRMLRLDPFDAASAAAFIDKYRGRGPENPVR